MNDKRNERPESYPRPSETDNQWQNQPEFIDQQPNDFNDTGNQVKQANDPGEETVDR